MSRSRKAPVYKDKRYSTQQYWKKIRTHWNQTSRLIKKSNYDLSDIVELDYKNPKSIINDWDYSGYILTWWTPMPWESLQKWEEKFEYQTRK